jgi:hypothetical protein
MSGRPWSRCCGVHSAPASSYFLAYRALFAWFLRLPRVWAWAV